jgi:hypothetical protein
LAQARNDAGLRLAIYRKPSLAVIDHALLSALFSGEARDSFRYIFHGPFVVAERRPFNADHEL